MLLTTDFVYEYEIERIKKAGRHRDTENRELQCSEKRMKIERLAPSTGR
jgi:hypothetical protein